MCAERINDIINKSFYRLENYCIDMKKSECEFIERIKKYLVLDSNEFNDINDIRNFVIQRINNFYEDNIDELSLSSLQLLCKYKYYFDEELSLFKGRYENENF